MSDDLNDMKVCCVFSLKSPHRGDSTEHTTYHFHYKKENHPKFSQIFAMGCFARNSRTSLKYLW